MKRLFIIGAGPFGRELFEWFKQDSNYTNRFSFAGFLDNRKSLLDDHGAEYEIVETLLISLFQKMIFV